MFTVNTFSVNPLGENCYVISDETHEAIIIDCGAMYETEKTAIADYITQNELHPVAHLLTHAHFDHLFGAGFIHERYGLTARCPEGDLAFFNDIDGQMRAILGGHTMECKTGPAGEPITPDTIVRFGSHSISVIPTPGHTPGGVCYYCEAEHILFSGDSLFQLSIGRTDFPGGNHWDLIRSLSHLLRDLPADVTIYPGHGPATNAQTERLHNPYLAG